MTRADQIALVARSCAAVDGGDDPALLATPTGDCVFNVETHGVRPQGHADIDAMVRRLWAGHAAVRHHWFTHMPAPAARRTAPRFSVENTEHDGTLTRKSNCSFFAIAGDRFPAVAVYMAGSNTPRRGT